jgi:beta-phosphoglucomutase-like phosphatase (HAD superfamily)
MRTLLQRAVAVLFDFDGVLVDSEPYYFRSYQKAFQKRGHTLDQEEYWIHWTSLGEGISGEVRRHDLGYGPDEIEAISREGAQEYGRFSREGSIPFFPEMLEALRLLLDSGCSCAIASSSAEEDIRNIFASSARLEPPCPVVGRRSGLRPKPHSDIYVYAAGALGVLPTDCVVIEDAEKGIAAASAVGMSSIVVRNRLNRSISFEGADAVVDSHEDFLRQVRRWTQQPGGA